MKLYRHFYFLAVQRKLYLWIDTNSLKDLSARARIRVRLNRVRLGNFGDCKPVGKGVNELRVDYGPGYRIYYGKSKTSIVILLCGGSKKSQAKDIQLAQKY